MSRYIKDIITQAEPQNVYEAIMQFLTSEGYEYIQYDGENVFKKGKGVLSSPTFFKFTYGNNSVRMETWMKYPILPGVYVGELGVTGMIGAACKGPWKRRIAQLESILTNLRVMGEVSGNFEKTTGINAVPRELSPNNAGGASGTVVNGGYVSNPVREENYESRQPAFCTNCGAELKNSAAFCVNCGAQTGNPKTVVNQPIGQNAPAGVAATVNTVHTPVAGRYISKKEFIRNYCQPSLKRDVRNVAIACYIFAGLSFLLSVALNPLGIFDSLLLVGLTLGMHLGKSKVCAILILILGIFEFLLGIILGGGAGYLWPVVGIAAVVTFGKIDKQYRQFMAGNPQ